MSAPGRMAVLAAVVIWTAAAADVLAQDDAASDRAALEALYAATGGKRWTNRTNWRTAARLGDWHGVTTDADGRVTGLDLHRNGLAGPIPPALGSLTRLESLDLGRNGLTGPIPGALGSLVDLESLILSRNDFTGPVPPALGGLANLELISLGSNALTGPIPDALAGLAKLRELYLYDNHLTGPVPAWVGDLAGLETLVLAFNPLTGTLPRSLTRLSLLADLDIGRTEVCAPGDDEFRAWLAGIDDFSGATCNGPPEAVGTIPAQALTLAGAASGVSVEAYFADPDDDELTYAAASGNAGAVTVVVSGDTVWLVPGAAGTATVAVTASDPDGLSAAQTVSVTTVASGPGSEREVLEALYDATGGADWTNGTNWKTSLPLASWHGVTVDDHGRATGLDLGENGLAGSLPAALEGLGRLEALNLSGNALRGPIPAALGGVTSLETLNLSRNALSGPIPAELAGLTRLETLDLSRNALSGPIPAELGSLTRLETLDLSRNALTGPIPERLGGLNRVRWLNLGRNALTGPIPEALANLRTLRELYLTDNALTGPIPDSLGSLSTLRGLYLGGNDLTGPIPGALRDLVNLHSLDLGWNHLTGPFPDWLASLRNLRGLYLPGTALTGQVPAALGRRSGFSALDLSYTWGLSGPLPSGLAYLESEDARLDVFLSRVCAPAAWLDWLETIDFDGRLCGEDPRVTIDVAVVYTPAAREAAGGADAIAAAIDLMIAETNQAYAASGQQQRLALVERSEVRYDETGDSALDVSRLAGRSDGHMDEVHALRGRVGADLVHLIVDPDRADLGGIAYRPGAFGLSILLDGGWIFAHELGHNMGLRHDRYQAHHRQGGARSHPAFGYVNPGASAADAARSRRWRTVMAYNTQCTDVHALCSRLLRFSNPRQRFNGEPLGVSYGAGGSGATGPADATSVVEATAPAVARWRDRPDGANQPPAGAGALPDRRLMRHDRLDVDLSAAFADPDGDRLSHEVSSSAPEVVTVLASGARLTLAAVGIGAATIRVTAADPGGLSATRSFAVAVAPGANLPPAAVATLPDRTLQVGATLEMDLSAAFADPDQDPLAFAASSSAPEVVTVLASGARLTLTAAALGTATIRVSATEPGGRSAAQSFTVTVTRSAPFTDDPLQPGVTPVRAVHFTELRTRIDVLRRGSGLGPFPWTDAVLTPGETPVRLAHLLEPREALAEAYAAAGRPAPRWTDASPVAGTTAIRAAHLTELRAAVMALE